MLGTGSSPASIRFGRSSSTTIRMEGPGLLWGRGRGEVRRGLAGAIRPMIEFEEKEKALQLTKVKPDVECEYCRGTGKRVSTYNPSPSGTGGSSVAGGWDDPGGLPGVRGQRVQLRRRPSPVEVHISSVPSLLKHPNSIPFALVLPDGEWAEKGEMGWWGMVSNEKKRTDWEVSGRGASYQVRRPLHRRLRSAYLAGASTGVGRDDQKSCSQSGGR